MHPLKHPKSNNFTSITAENIPFHTARKKNPPRTIRITPVVVRRERTGNVSVYFRRKHRILIPPLPPKKRHIKINSPSSHGPPEIDVSSRFRPAPIFNSREFNESILRRDRRGWTGSRGRGPVREPKPPRRTKEKK